MRSSVADAGHPTTARPHDLLVSRTLLAQRLRRSFPSVVVILRAIWAVRVSDKSALQGAEFPQDLSRWKDCMLARAERHAASSALLPIFLPGVAIDLGVCTRHGLAGCERRR